MHNSEKSPWKTKWPSNVHSSEYPWWPVNPLGVVMIATLTTRVPGNTEEHEIDRNNTAHWASTKETEGRYLDTGWKTTRSSSPWGTDWCRGPPRCCVLRQLSLVPGRTLQCSTLSLCYWGRCTSHSQAAPSTVHRFLIQNSFELHDRSIKKKKKRLLLSSRIVCFRKTL